MGWGEVIKVRSLYKMPNPQEAYSVKEVDLYFERNAYGYYMSSMIG